jgi:hypothetical protein
VDPARQQAGGQPLHRCTDSRAESRFGRGNLRGRLHHTYCGQFDDGGTGATWVFIHGASGWSQQAKLVGADAIGKAQQGGAVALSADGNLAVASGWRDNFAGDANRGASWIYIRSNGVWLQMGNKPVYAGPASDYPGLDPVNLVPYLPGSKPQET